MGVFATKKELLYTGILTAIFALIVIILVFTLPLSKDVPKDTNDVNKDVNNFNPAFDGNNVNLSEKLAEDQNKAYNECVSICKEYKDTIDYSVGPCLSDQFGFKIDNWACDIAHTPRITEDNESQNQCQTILNGSANRFVELDENCAIIR
jgi:hypothetical protein